MNAVRQEELINAFKARFGADLTVEVQADGNPPRYEFLLTSGAFKGTSHLKRQDDVWEVIDGLLTREEAFEVTGVLPLAPAEAAELLAG